MHLRMRIFGHWVKEGERLYQLAVSGAYVLSPMQVIYRQGPSSESWAQWSARDALVLKWVSLLIKDSLPIQDSCMHVAGRRGGRDSLCGITQCITEGARYVYRTDIRGYYQHIRKEQVYGHICRYIRQVVLRDLVHQYLYYSVEDGGEFYSPISGICRGCSLSPLLGASLLWHVDSYFSGLREVMYARYMDDFIFLSERRWAVRRARSRLHDYFDLGGFEVHPDKTQVGKIEKGFDWLGVWFTEEGATGIAPRALENHRQRRLRLEEQARRRKLPEAEIAERVQRYERRWRVWAAGQLRSAGVCAAD